MSDGPNPNKANPPCAGRLSCLTPSFVSFPTIPQSRELRATTVAEWVWSPNADISTPTAQEWVREAVADLEIFVKQRPEDRYLRQMLAIHLPQLGGTCSPSRQ